MTALLATTFSTFLGPSFPPTCGATGSLAQVLLRAVAPPRNSHARVPLAFAYLWADPRLGDGPAAFEHV